MNFTDQADSIRHPVRGHWAPREQRLVVNNNVAENLLNVCVRQVDNLLSAGPSRSMKCGRKILISAPSLKLYVSARLTRRSKSSTPFALRLGRDAA